jgi:hypothetical protein
MRKCNNAVVAEKLRRYESSARGCTVIMEQPIARAPHFRSFSPNVLPQTAKNIAVEPGVHGLALGGTRQRIVSTFLGVELVEGRPDLLSSSIDVLPLLKRACHSKHVA